jgi:hypothetical protein
MSVLGKRPKDIVFFSKMVLAISHHEIGEFPRFSESSENETLAINRWLIVG